MNGQTGSNGLWLYQCFERLGWPRSYIGKVFLIAFVATHIPLMTLIGYLIFAPADDISKLEVLGLAVLATLIGTTLIFWALHQMLKPILLAKSILSVYFKHGQVLRLHTRFQDEVGLLLNNVADAIQIFEQNRIMLEKFATEDFLTGLPNRRAADIQLQQSLNLALRNQMPLCIALLDIDYFKQVNDSYGHAVGDQVLTELSKCLKQRSRGGDWVARWGGEEFLLVLFADKHGCHSALERIREQLANLRVVSAGTSIQFTVSIGFTTVGQDYNPLACLERADRALYQAKQAGRNRVSFS